VEEGVGEFKIVKRILYPVAKITQNMVVSFRFRGLGLVGLEALPAVIAYSLFGDVA